MSLGPAVVRRARQSDLAMLSLPDGSCAIYDRVTGATHLCSPLAGAALALCERGVEREALVEELARMHEEPLVVVQGRIAQAIAELEGLGLIELVEP